MSRVRQAVILAAGMGTRLRGQWKDLPKGFLRLGQRPIIEESIGKLIHCGIDEVIIVTGYQREKFEELAGRFPFVKTVVNNEYETTGSMKSLTKANTLVKGDFLLLEADLIYEINALQILQNTDRKNCVLLSGETFSGDEVYADVKNNKIVKFSKSKGDVASVGGELVGISRISIDLFKEMNAWEAGRSGKYDYENCLSDISHIEKIEFEFVGNLAWCEIDDARHLEQARTIVYPLVCDRDSHVSLHRKAGREVLLNPGPATTTDSVKYAMITEDICPREPEFGEMVEGIRRDLVLVVHGDGQYEAILFASSGTGAVESCLTSVIPPGKSVLIINNGAYGERMEKICDGFGIPHVDYDIEWGKPLDLRVLESRLFEHRRVISHLAFVHHETTVGILNPLKEIAALAHAEKLGIIVDAMSSFAGIPIDLRTCNVDYLVSSANKCLQGMPGVSFVICKKDALEAIQDFPRRNFYFNLYDNFRFFHEQRQMQFTPPVHVLYALQQAINEYFLEGEAERYRRYSESYETLIRGLEELGFRFFVDRNYHSRLLTSIVDPDDERFDFADMHEYLKRKGFTVYPGKLADKRMFRIANIGDINRKDIESFLVLLSDYLGERGISSRRDLQLLLPATRGA